MPTEPTLIAWLGRYRTTASDFCGFRFVRPSSFYNAAPGAVNYGGLDRADRKSVV